MEIRGGERHWPAGIPARSSPAARARWGMSKRWSRDTCLWSRLGWGAARKGLAGVSRSSGEVRAAVVRRGRGCACGLGSIRMRWGTDSGNQTGWRSAGGGGSTVRSSSAQPWRAEGVLCCSQHRDWASPFLGEGGGIGKKFSPLSCATERPRLRLFLKSDNYPIQTEQPSRTRATPSI